MFRGAAKEVILPAVNGRFHFLKFGPCWVGKIKAAKPANKAFLLKLSACLAGTKSGPVEKLQPARRDWMENPDYAARFLAVALMAARLRAVSLRSFFLSRR